MEAPKSLCKGSSLSVQELAKEAMLLIPQHYVCPEEDLSIPSDGSSLPTIPTIDLDQLVSGETTYLELEKLHFVCKEWGIFQLVNHGVSSLVVDNMKNEVQEFYNLPLEEKMRYKIKAGDFEGETLESYMSELQKLAMTLLGLMAKALKINKGEIEEMFEDGVQSVRMTYYPPCPLPQKVMGLTAHSDPTGITILLEVNGVQGFQVKRDGIWIPVNILPGAFVVNVGDVLEIFSNGLYKSIEHRATVNSERERMSLAMFFDPKFQSEVGTAASLLDPQNPPLFKRVGMEKYVRDFFSRKLDGKSFLEEMRRAENGEDDAI
ncbi:hypothetical protein Vadar_016080 [Vaccinium darrowii]|uniref:Uncharacterized protein n=1 Tax=Vaccinium darrowii TaxID=229202 RepID=A0ACB7XA33_9ERIC|nr:hypothetical protein Vadar_016080 [Vaccinium darrowii]